MSHEWIKINPSEYDEPRTETIRGVDVEVFLSPYEIPREVSGYYDEGVKKFMIVFKYIGDGEATEAVKEDDFITAIVGRQSHRLYRLELDVHGMAADLIELKVSGPKRAQAAIDHLSSSVARPRRGNYQTAKQVIADKGSQIFAASQ